MGNWLRCKNKIILAALISLAIGYKIPPWGFTGHRTINRMAVFLLPKEIIGFYKINIEYLTSESTKPDSRRYSVKHEGAGHYIDLEYYDTTIVKYKNWNNLIKIYPEDSLYKHGILPWRIAQYKFLLQESFEKKDYKKILKYSSEIGHYLADAHVPLHTTRNYNGQLTNQIGIHSLWETKIVNLIIQDINFFNKEVKYIENVNKYIWEIIIDSHSKVKPVLNIEKELEEENNIPKYNFKLNSFSQNSITNEYILEYNKRLKGMVEDRIKKSIYCVASIWYTAWIDAGQPLLKEIEKKKLFSHNEHNYHECK